MKEMLKSQLNLCKRNLKENLVFTWKDVLITLSILLVTIVVILLDSYFSLNETDVIMMYILGILIIANRTNGYLYGIVASILSVLSVNFFFILPLYSFKVYNQNFLLTFVIMFFVAIAMSTTTVKLRKQREVAQSRERRMEHLYNFSKQLITVTSIEEIVGVGLQSISDIFQRDSICILLQEDGTSSKVFQNRKNVGNIDFLVTSSIVRIIPHSISKPTMIKLQSNQYIYCFPIIGQSKRLGVLGVIRDTKLAVSDENKLLLTALQNQLALALEREMYAEKEHMSQVVMERERLRGNLLRSVSHDLRTPLTGILGSTETLLQNEALHHSTKKELLQNIASDTKWLIHSVENILNITKVDEGKLDLHKSYEVIEEIVAGAVNRVAKNDHDHFFNLSIPDEFIMVPMDSVLIQQVLINLLDNAIKYTVKGTVISVNVWVESDNCYFEVSDNGDGIAEKDLPHIFDQFYRSNLGDTSGRKGIGLGLAICKSIVQAHGGEMTVKNNKSGGASFLFTLPGGVVRYE